MKTFFRVSALGLLMIVLTAFSASAVMAQDDDAAEKKSLYECFVANYDKNTVEQKQKAIDCAKDYIAKFPDDKQYVDYFNGAIPDLEKWIKNKKEQDRLEAERKARITRLQRLNTAYQATVANPNDASKWDEYFAAGEDVLKYEPEFIDVSIVLASGGSEIPKETDNSKFRTLTTKYAKRVIEQIQSGVKSNDNKWGEFRWVYGSKENALGWMNVYLADIIAESDKAAAMPYYYKATQFDSGAKNWYTYRIIGQWYLDEAVKIGKERTALLNTTTELEKTAKTDEEKAQVDANIEKMKEMLAMEKGYADRAIDAYARAYSLASANGKVKAADKETLFNTLKDLFAFRYSDPKDELKKSEANIKSYVATVDKKEMPNPATAVEPVKAEETPSDKPADANKDEAKSSDMKTGATRSRTVSKATDNR